MLATPAETPVTIPDVVFTVATEVLLLLHVPPATPQLSVVCEHTYIEAVPLIAVTVRGIVLIR